MKSKYIIRIVNLLAIIYLIYILYFKGTTKLNFVLGNIIIGFYVFVMILKIYLNYKLKKQLNDKDYELINEVLDELEEEKKLAC